MLTSTTNICLLLLTLYISTTASTTTTTHYHHNRHLLHQPFVPQETFPPTQPPTTSSPQPQPTPNPKYPFTTTITPPSTTEKPFFPTIPSPPPPPPPATAVVTFPANISSLLLPHQTSSPTQRHVVAIAVSVSLLCAAVIVAVSALFLYSRTIGRHPSIPTVAAAATAEKTSHSEDSSRLFPPNTAPSDKPPRYTSPSVSSEFLYLGTLVNSRGEIEQQQQQQQQEKMKKTKNSNKSTNNTNNTANVASVKFNVLSSSASSTYQKLGSGSPELKPLPPLPRHNYYSYTSGEAEVKIVSAKGASECVESEGGDDDNEEFFSPRGSSGHRESPKRHGSSSSRRDFQGIINGVDNLGSRSFNSRTASYPYSNSCSPSISISSSMHSPVNNVKSPDSAVNFPAPPTATMMKRSHSSISSSSSSSVASLQNKQCLEGDSGCSKGFVAVKLPPPPPPPPPPRFWEMPVMNSGPPVLVTPSKPVLSPHLANEQLGAERKEEETPTKPKLKPLHWDKVRASSDRAMVWDQIKASSFQ